MIIKIDIDGVLRDILSTICEIYNKEFFDNIQPEDVDRYNVNEMFPLIKEIYDISAVEFFFERHSFEIFRCSACYSGVKEAIDKLKELGHTIVIVSYQKTIYNKIDTLLWLAQFNIYYDDICFTNNKDIVKGDIMVDDNPEFLYQISKDCQTILIDMPYNKNCKDFTRHKTFIDFVNSLA